MHKNNADIYDPQFVKGMFDRMSKTYGLTNYIASFGFTDRWRRQCINDLPFIEPDAVGFDMMSGMGESWGEIQKRIGANGQITALDISDEMNRKGKKHLKRFKLKNIKQRKLNVLQNDIPSISADFIVSTFGIKTFNLGQQKIFAKEINRILKPGGVFALIEISEPNSIVLKWSFMFYIKMIIPLIGRLLGNLEGYQMLGKYCEEFKSLRIFHGYLREEGLNATFKNYFGGCATGVYGTKSENP